MFTGGIHEENETLLVQDTSKSDYRQYLYGIATGSKSYSRIMAAFWHDKNWLIVVF